MKSENRIQQECVMWFHNTYPSLRGLLFAVPNGGARSAREGKLFKMTGVIPGVADMLFMYKGKTYCFELKTEKGEQSKFQVEWEWKICSQGFDYFLVRRLTQFQTYINRIVCEMPIDGGTDYSKL